MKKILILDDERDIGELLKDYLHAKGYATFIATDSETAFQILEVEQPDLVFLDVVMPKCDGLECLVEIKKLRPETIVVMISGLQNEQIAKEAIQKGAYDYVTKPFDLRSLEENILSRVFPD